MEWINAWKIQAYTNISQEQLTSLIVNMDIINCFNKNCNNQQHLCEIDKFYDDIINSLHQASACLIKDRQPNAGRQLPGWNEYCKETHSVARDAFLSWRANGSPHFGPTYELMSRSRSHFKSAIRQCKANKDKAAADSLARKLLAKNDKGYWKEVKLWVLQKIDQPQSQWEMLQVQMVCVKYGRNISKGC